MAPGELIALARGLLDRAHAPYSRFPVAAVVVDEDGRVHGGVNVENASYGLTVCAERVAIFAAVAAGARGLRTLAVTAQRLKPVMPCGACRQVIAEFLGPEAQVHSDDPEGRIVTWTVGELLPHAFTARSLTGAPSAVGD
jgi:cytidine deaminase